jgi:hypothetical protein
MEHATTYWKENYWAGVTNGRFKYVWYFRDYPAQFFDLEKDPDEVKNVLNQSHIDKEMKQEIQKWRGHLIDYLRERGPGFVKNNQLVKRQKNMLYSPNYPSWDEDDPKWLKYWKAQYKKSFTISLKDKTP